MCEYLRNGDIVKKHVLEIHDAGHKSTLMLYQGISSFSMPSLKSAK